MFRNTQNPPKFCWHFVSKKPLSRCFRAEYGECDILVYCLENMTSVLWGKKKKKEEKNVLAPE